MKLRLTFPLAAVLLALLLREAAGNGNNSWRSFTQADGLPENACAGVSVGAAGNVLVRPAHSNVLAILEGYSTARIPLPESARLGVFESPAGQLWALTAEGFREFRDGVWLPRPWPEAGGGMAVNPAAALALCPVRQGRVLVLFPDCLMEWDSGTANQPVVRLIRRVEQTALGRFHSFHLGPGGSLWISAAHGVAKIQGPIRSLKLDGPWAEIIFPQELQIADTQTVVEDAAGVIAVRAESVATGAPVAAQFDGRLWSVAPAELGPIRFAWRADGHTWLVNSNVLWEWEGGSAVPQRREELRAHAITGAAVEAGGAFWLATDQGLFRHLPTLWQTEPMPPRAAAAMPRPPATIPDELGPHSQWTAFLTARYGDLWLGGGPDVAWRHRGEWRIFNSTNQIGPEDVSAFAESPEGRVYCTTPGKVWEFDGKYWMSLRGGFEGIHDLHCGRDGTLWVATDQGLYRYERGSWIANGPDEGLPALAVLRVVEDDEGRISVETSAGWSRFHPEADQDPPQTQVRSTATGEPTFREDSTVTLTMIGSDKWKQTVAERLLFSYRFDEREWTPFRDGNEVALSDLSLGKHYFQVRAMDRNGNVELQPGRLEFAMTLPWYRETRLVLVLAGALALALSFAALAMNRHRKLRRSYAEVERAIAERTRELEQANLELVHGQKMNALGTLAAGIAHDFNNILSIVKGSAQIIEENLGNPDKVRIRLDRIKTVVQQGAGIVEAMLGFSRASGESASASDINAVVEDTLTLLGDRFLREVEVQFQRGTNLPTLTMPRDFVQQVLLNFIFNAVEASAGRKSLELATEVIPTLPPGVVLAPARGGPFVRITVRDFGCGITPENLPRIFEPFFTTKALSARRGTGLGLSMVYELARKMDAGLAVETQLGRGSVFSLVLPVLPNATPVAKKVLVNS